MPRKYDSKKQGRCVPIGDETDYIFIDTHTTEQFVKDFSKADKVIKTNKGFVVYWDEDGDVTFMPFNTYNVKYSINSNDSMNYTEEQFYNHYKVVE